MMFEIFKQIGKGDTNVFVALAAETIFKSKFWPDAKTLQKQIFSWEYSNVFTSGSYHASVW